MKPPYKVLLSVWGFLGGWTCEPSWKWYTQKAQKLHHLSLTHLSRGCFSEPLEYPEVFAWVVWATSSWSAVCIDHYLGLSIWRNATVLQTGPSTGGSKAISRETFSEMVWVRTASRVGICCRIAWHEEAPFHTNQQMLDSVTFLTPSLWVPSEKLICFCFHTKLDVSCLWYSVTNNPVSWLHTAQIGVNYSLNNNKTKRGNFINWAQWCFSTRKASQGDEGGMWVQGWLDLQKKKKHHLKTKTSHQW